MNVLLEPRMDKPEFLTWVQAREGRYELAGSRVMMMTGGSRGHAILVRRLAAALEKRLDSGRWTVLTSDFGVDLGPARRGGFSPEPAFIEGQDAVIAIAALGVDLRLSEIYAGLEQR